VSIFVDLKTDKVVQAGDKTRLDATRSFIAKGSEDITLVEIEPEEDAGFIDITGDSSEDWFLDWAYATEGEKTVTVRITTDGDPVALEKEILVLTEEEDSLLSTDQDLIALESDLMKYLPEGKNSFIYVHRKAQSLILDYLDKNGFKDINKDRLTKEAFVQKEPFNSWSKFMSLRLIFFDMSNQPDDHWMEKSKEYLKLEEAARTRVSVPLDLDGDGEISETEKNTRFDSIRAVIV
jgi:hypothetical protein